DHISLVKGTHSLEVKGDLARKVAGALGIKVEGDIVLESSSRISLKAGGSFIVIHAGGVDIMGPKINLNGGGSAGVPVSTLQPGVLGALEDDDKDDDAEDGKDNGDGGDDVAGGGDDEQDDQEKYHLRFHFITEDGVPYANTKYVVYFADGTQREGITDDEGYSDSYIKDSKETITAHLLLGYY
ncbi:TPA: type VI secretion system tip protein VgrG, partial [Salmonella enterica subsp. enterica serovar Ball]|nr:type VI secretion system tip protein VgrG [Salmonella enterica subsp. enterica serovar Ball]HCA3486651.1 type VI secretion system tip protein VgrG [Salmonella enterica subsp. enterica serovar Ball]HCA3561113.1 type VI secretion system tip protein VgrG [Salmonella enterica subsp. enterica serovar Ball]